MENLKGTPSYGELIPCFEPDSLVPPLGICMYEYVSLCTTMYLLYIKASCMKDIISLSDIHGDSAYNDIFIEAQTCQPSSVFPLS